MTNEQKQKTCNNCKHYGGNLKNEDGSPQYYTVAATPCLRLPLKEVINLVNGKTYMVEQLRCDAERNPGGYWPKSENPCGAEGKYFEPAE